MDENTPLIFVLSPGSDPLPYLYDMGKHKNMDSHRIEIMSLGSGQS